MANFFLAAGIFLLNVLLNGPLFLPGEMVYRDSIEGGYAAMARFLASHPNPWGWNPQQYCGLPTQFTYLPGLPYLAALLIRALPAWEPGHVYRIVAATLACLGPVTLFLFSLYFTRNRWWALAAALAYTFVSPVYGLARQIDKDRGLVQLPWRLHVLAKYGEGPHNAGLTLLPLALIALWAAATGRKYWQILVAAVMLAAVTLTNWVAGAALALCSLLLMLAGWGSANVPGFRMRRVVAAAALAYLVACFWLTPSFVKTTALNWPVDAFNYHWRWQQTALLAGLVAGLFLLRALFLSVPEQWYLCFLTLNVFAFAYIVLNFYWFGQAAIPESRRYALELEMFLILILFELFRLALRSANVAEFFLGCLLGGILLWLGVPQAWRCATKGYQRWRPIPAQDTVEHRLASWIAQRRPTGRVFASGGVRFRLNSWFDLQQVGGTFESGLANRTPVQAAYQIRTGMKSAPGEDGSDAILQLKTLGVEYVVVNGPRSREHYRDFKNPGKFEGLLKAVYRHQDDVIYQLPGASLAHLVRPGELPQFPLMAGYLFLLQTYVTALDDPRRPDVKTNWRQTDDLLVEGPVPEGMVVSLQVTHDPGWTAFQQGHPVRIEKDKLGFMTLHARPSPSARIELRYRGTREQRMMAALSALAWAGALGGLLVRRRLLRRQSPQRPAVAGGPDRQPQ